MKKYENYWLAALMAAAMIAIANAAYTGWHKVTRHGQVHDVRRKSLRHQRKELRYHNMAERVALVQAKRKEAPFEYIEVRPDEAVEVDSHTVSTSEPVSKQGWFTVMAESNHDKAVTFDAQYQKALDRLAKHEAYKRAHAQAKAAMKQARKDRKTALRAEWAAKKDATKRVLDSGKDASETGTDATATAVA